MYVPSTVPRYVISTIYTVHVVLYVSYLQLTVKIIHTYDIHVLHIHVCVYDIHHVMYTELIADCVVIVRLVLDCVRVSCVCKES